MKRVREVLGAVLVELLGVALLWYFDAPEPIILAYLAVSFLVAVYVGRERRRERAVQREHEALKESLRPAKPRRKIPGAVALRRIQNVAYSYPWQWALGWGLLIGVVLKVFTIATWVEVATYGVVMFLAIGLWCSRQRRRREKARRYSL